MNEKIIREKAIRIIREITGNMLPADEEMSVNEKLCIILGESLQSLILVTSLEDEFDIEFDDDQIDLEFFQDIDSIIGKVRHQLIRKGFSHAGQVASDLASLASPALLEGAARGWPAMHLWTLPYLREEFSGATLDAERHINNVRETRRFSIGEYIDYAADTTDETPFYLTNCQLHLSTEMTKHYTPPVFGHCWYKQFETEKEKYELSWLFIGASNTRSVLHVDRWDTSAWNAVISGLKLWVFYDPKQSEYLYQGKVDPFAPDHVKYPLFHHATPLVCLQGPGDVVFTPSGWWHAVLNIELGISVTENFINASNYLRVADFFKRHNQPNSLATLEKIIAQHTAPSFIK